MALLHFAKNTFFATIAGGSTALGSFIGSVIVARTLGPAGAGAVALALWFASTAVTVCDLGLPLTISRFLPDLNARGQTEEAAALGHMLFPPVLLTTLFGAVLAAGLYLFSQAINRNFPGVLPFQALPNLTWLAIGLVFCAQAIGNFGLSQLRGQQRFELAAKLSLVSFFIQIIAVAVGSRFLGEDGALLGYASAGFIPAFFALNLRPGKVSIDRILARRAWQFALNSWAAGLVSTIVWSRSELAFLSYWRGQEETGFYAVGLTLSLLATQVPLFMTGGLLALFSERYARNDHEGLTRAFASAMRFMSLMLFPACFGMAAITPVLLPLFFGDKFAGADQVASFLVAAQAFGSVSTVTSVFLFATEKSRFLVHVGVWGALGLLVAGFTIIPAFGLMGTAATRAVVQISLAAAAAIYIERKLACPMPYRSLLRILVAAAICALAARLILVALPNEAGLFVAIPAACLVYLLCVRLLRVLPEDDIERLRSLAQRLPSRLAAAALPLLRFLGPAGKVCAEAD